MRGFRRMVKVKTILRWRRERRGNDSISDAAFEVWRQEFNRMNLPERDATDLLWQHRITIAVMRFYFHSGYSPKGASEEIVEMFTSRRWHMMEMRGRIQRELHK